MGVKTTRVGRTLQHAYCKNCGTPTSMAGLKFGSKPKPYCSKNCMRIYKVKKALLEGVRDVY